MCENHTFLHGCVIGRVVVLSISNLSRLKIVPVEMILRIVILSFFCAIIVKAQENAASSVSKSLIECYNKTENLNKENRPAYTMNVLIELIRKIESGPSLQNDRELSKEIIHRFKQDGIIRFSMSESSPYTVPFTPKGLQSDKHRIFLKKLVPGNAINFPNETLTELQKCSLHFMLSNTVDLRQRGDESTTCKKFDRFVRRIRRDTFPDDDVETFDTLNSSPLKGNLLDDGEEQIEENVVDAVDTSVAQNPGSSRTVITLTLSDCPIEDGVVYTKWGAVQAGTVIAGIAAGRQQQTIQTTEQYVVDNRYAATLTGDLAEVGLHQGSIGKEQVTVGAKGGWNGIEVPRWYFIEKNNDFQMTDAEIRGGLDGLIIAKNIQAWHDKTKMLKLSQVLDMYYSTRGVFSKTYRACNRNKLFSEVAPVQELKEQTIAFSFLLEPDTRLHGSITSEGIKRKGAEAVDSLFNYITNIINDLDCSIEEDKIVRIATDITIVIDTQWPFAIAQRIIGYLLDNLDINSFDSSYSIINGRDGSPIIDNSRSLVQFYDNYTSKVHLTHPTGFDVSRIFTVIEETARQKFNERGRSKIVLFLPYGIPNDNDKNIANSRKEYLKSSAPDMKLLVLGRGSKDAYGDLVVDSSTDAFGVTETAIADSIKPLISRIKQIPRKIINSNCGGGSGGPQAFDQYVEPGGINFYRIASNYLYGDGSKTVKIKGSGYGNLIACTSTQNSLPDPDKKENDVTCENISTNEVVFTISGTGPVYFSVYAPPNEGGSTVFNCIDNGCRFIDNVKFTIQADGLDCGESGSFRLLGNMALLITTLVFIILRA